MRNRTKPSENGPKAEVSTPTSSKRIGRVWKALTDIYGSAFTSMHGVRPTPIWEHAVAKLTDDQCRIGLDLIVSGKLERKNATFPINLEEFVKACKGSRGPQLGPRYRQIARQKSSPETAKKYLDNMRKLFGPAPKPEPTYPTGPRDTGPGCTCQARGECEVCQRWAKIVNASMGPG